MDYISKEMNKLGADGVDFVPVWFDKRFSPPIICSYTKEEWKHIQSYPKSDRMYWRMIDGKKEYVNK